MLIAQFITSFIASAGFGILFNIPRKALVQSGLVGMFGWMLYYYLVNDGMDPVPATLFAASLVSFLSYICSKLFKTPIIVYAVSGIIPLVPGGVAFNAMRQFVQHNYDIAIQLSAQVLLLAGAIALGLMFSEIINQIITKLSKD